MSALKKWLTYSRGYEISEDSKLKLLNDAEDEYKQLKKRTCRIQKTR